MTTGDMVALIAALFQQLPQPPVNWIYAGLLALIALLLGIIGWGLRSMYTDVREWRLATDAWIRKLDRRLVKIETRLSIDDSEE